MLDLTVFTLANIQFHPDTGTVALLVTHPMAPGGFYLNTTEAALQARMDPPGENWGNDEAVAEGQALLDVHPLYGGNGYTLVLATPPA